MKTPPAAPPLSLVCDALENVMSSSSPLALIQARPHLVDLVRGVRELEQRVTQLERRGITVLDLI
jgi:hypothetical protein